MMIHRHHVLPAPKQVTGQPPTGNQPKTVCHSCPSWKPTKHRSLIDWIPNRVWDDGADVRFGAQVGFTLLEVLLSVALITLITGSSVAVYQSFQVRNDLDIAATTMAQTERRAQVLAESSAGDTSWGVNVQSGTITLFKGASYATRDASFDELSAVPTSITPSGFLEVVFAKFTGLPTTTGTTTLTSSINETRAIAINAKGMVSY
jgi:type II secretory pathway pseudopilin PulG